MSQEVDAEKKARNLIDGMLENSGWNIVRRGYPMPNKGYFAVEEVDTPTGPMDYGLYLDGVLIGDVFAPMTSESDFAVFDNDSPNPWPLIPP